jgi:hypothetical protein
MCCIKKSRISPAHVLIYPYLSNLLSKKCYNKLPNLFTNLVLTYCAKIKYARSVAAKNKKYIPGKGIIPIFAPKEVNGTIVPTVTAAEVKSNSGHEAMLCINGIFSVLSM